MPTDDPTPTDPASEESEATDADPLPDDPAADIGPEIPRAPDLTDDEPSLAAELGFGESEASDSAGASVDPELAKRFWSLVLIFNVALLAMSLGVMLVGFEGMWRLGGGLFIVGAFSFLRGWHRYRSIRKD